MYIRVKFLFMRIHPMELRVELTPRPLVSLSRTSFTYEPSRPVDDDDMRSGGTTSGGVVYHITKLILLCL